MWNKTTHAIECKQLIPALPVREWMVKKKWKSGKIYHVRNVIGRENFITCGRVNVLVYALWTEYNRSVVLTLEQQNVNSQCTTLPSNTAWCWQVYTDLYIHLKMTLTYLPGKLTAIYREEWLSMHYNITSVSFPSSFLYTCCLKKLPERTSTKTRL